MLCKEQVDYLRQYTDEDIDRLISRCGLPSVDPLNVLIAREKYQPGFVSGLRMQ